MKEIGDVLIGTKFEELIPKIEASGYRDLASLGRLKNTEKLLDFLKNFESDDRLYELSNLINSAVSIYQKKNGKKFFVGIIGGFGLILITIFAVFFFQGESHPTFNESENFQEAKSAADYYIQGMENDYQELCSKPRNSATRLEFLNLSLNIRDIFMASERCVLLDSDIQNRVNEYITEEIKKRPHLENLMELNIDCW